MQLSFETLIVLPIALGLLGFIEPCTIGGHLLFLNTLRARPPTVRIRALALFIIARSMVTGLFGAVAVYLGTALAGVQTGLWLVFGIVYLLIGLGLFAGKLGLLRQSISLAPDRWKGSGSAVAMGMAFGFNIPACAAPILFGLIGLAVTNGTALAGFGMMFLFGLSLSLPLVVFAANSSLADKLSSLKLSGRFSGWISGGVFIALGIWSIWFGLFVDPANWSGTR